MKKKKDKEPSYRSEHTSRDEVSERVRTFMLDNSSCDHYYMAFRVMKADPNLSNDYISINSMLVTSINYLKIFIICQYKELHFPGKSVWRSVQGIWLGGFQVSGIL